MKEEKKHRHKRKLLLALVLICLLGLLLPLASQVGNGNLIKTFKKRTPCGRLVPIRGLDVELWKDGELIGTDTTDYYGKVVFCPVENGNYTLKFSYGGVDYEEDVTVNGQTEIENVLTPKTCELRAKALFSNA